MLNKINSEKDRAISLLLHIEMKLKSESYKKQISKHQSIKTKITRCLMISMIY